MNINGYTVQASEPCNVIMAQRGAASAVHIKIEPVYSREVYNTTCRGKPIQKIIRHNIFWTVRWADTIKGGWNDFGVIKGKQIVKAVKRICKMHAGQ